MPSTTQNRWKMSAKINRTNGCSGVGGEYSQGVKGEQVVAAAGGKLWPPLGDICLLGSFTELGGTEGKTEMDVN